MFIHILTISSAHLPPEIQAAFWCHITLVFACKSYLLPPDILSFVYRKLSIYRILG